MFTTLKNLDYELLKVDRKEQDAYEEVESIFGELYPKHTKKELNTFIDKQFGMIDFVSQLRKKRKAEDPFGLLSENLLSATEDYYDAKMRRIDVYNDGKEMLEDEIATQHLFLKDATEMLESLDTVCSALRRSIKKQTLSEKKRHYKSILTRKMNARDKKFLELEKIDKKIKHLEKFDSKTDFMIKCD